MLIRCKILRANGTVVSLDGEKYHFQPHESDPNAHVAEVKNAAHKARFLSIREGYEVFTAKDKAEAESLVAALDADDEDAPDDLARMTDKELAEEFASVFGRVPNSGARRPDVENKIRAARLTSDVVEPTEPAAAPKPAKAKAAKAKPAAPAQDATQE